MQTTTLSSSARILLKSYFVVFGILLFAIAAFYFISSFALNADDADQVKDFILHNANSTLLLYILVGFAAQMIDGALGMAYGVSSTSFLLSTGVSPAVASASVHMAEVFTTAASGISHWRFGNIDRKLFLSLVIPGAVGAAIGAYLLTNIDGKVIKPYVAVYLGIMGVVIFIKAIRKVVAFKKPKWIAPLALFGGFVDNIGGGGWGPIVATTLLARGAQARTTIGSVNAAEFFVALTGASVFTLMIGIQGWHVIIGLIIGGLIAAPLGAFISSRINHKIMMIMVAMLIILLSMRTLVLVM